MSYNEMCQIMEDLHNSTNISQCMMIQNHTWVKNLFKVPERLMDFNVAEYKKFISMTPDSIFLLTLGNHEFLSLV